MLKNPQLIGACVGIVMMVFSLGLHAFKKRAPVYTDMAALIVSSVGTLTGIDLGYIVLTSKKADLGPLSEHQLPILLGALAVVWLSVHTIWKHFHLLMTHKGTDSDNSNRQV